MTAVCICLAMHVFAGLFVSQLCFLVYICVWLRDWLKGRICIKRHRQFKDRLSKRLLGLWTCSLEILNLWQSRGKRTVESLWTCGKKRKKDTEFISIHTSPISFGVVISKTAAAAEETVAWEGGGSLPDDQRALLETPGWSLPGWMSHAGKLRLPGGCCGWSTCRRGFLRTASSWIPGGEIPRQLPPRLDSQPSPCWRSHGTDPTTWGKEEEEEETDEDT